MNLGLSKGTLDISGRPALRKQGELTVVGPRQLLVLRSSFGAYNLDGRVAKETLRLSGKPNQFTDFPGPLVPEKIPPSEEVKATIDQPVVWGGCISDHYGHFLTDFVSRLWPMLPGGQLHGLPVIFPGIRNWPFVGEWLSAFGVQTIDIPSHGAVLFRKMYVPESAWCLNSWVAPEMRSIHLHARAGIKVPHCDSANILWLSRAGLPRDRVPYDERLFEWLLGDRVTVIRPEIMTLGEQIAAFEASSMVIGVMGSAFHTALMLRRQPKLVQLCPGAVSAPFIAQDGLLGTKSVYVHALTPTAMEPIRRARRPASYRILIPETIRMLRKLSGDESIASHGILSTLCEPEQLSPTSCRKVKPSQGDPDLETTVARVVMDALSITARMDLGMMLEKKGLADCAAEQFAMVSDLTQKYPLGPLQAARVFHAMGKTRDAAEMAKRALAINNKSDVARQYLDEDGQA